MFAAPGTNPSRIVYPSLNTTDSGEHSVTISCHPKNESFIDFGVTDVVCWASDGHRNHSTCNFQMNVTEGMLQIIKNI